MDREYLGAESTRPTASEIYDRVRENATTELERTPRSLGFSGLFAGFTIGASPLAMALAKDALGPVQGAELVAALVYPIGYAAVILGRAQFFTENTLYPVLLCLHDRAVVPITARLWAIVLCTNLAGAFAFTLLVAAGIVSSGAEQAMVDHGAEHVSAAFGSIVLSGVVAGWLLALVAWLVEATETAVGQFLVIASLTFLVGLGGFDHIVASSIDTVTAALQGAVSGGALAAWFGAAFLGNVAGGVLIVSLLNYGQSAEEAGSSRSGGG